VLQLVEGDSQKKNRSGLTVEKRAEYSDKGRCGQDLREMAVPKTLKSSKKQRELGGETSSPARVTWYKVKSPGFP